jgi:hypothetical protein
VSAQGKRRPQDVLDSLGDFDRLLRLSEVFQDDRELIAAEPRDGIAGSQTALESARCGDQELVPDKVAQAIIDRFEPIEIQEQHHEWACIGAPGAPDGVLQAVHEQRPFR